MRKSFFLAFILLSFFCKTKAQVDTNYLELDTTIIAGGLTIPWDIEWLDNNYMLFTELDGHIGLVDLKTNVAKRIYKIPDLARELQAGLMGLAIHPDFEENNLFFAAHTYYHKKKLFIKVNQYKFYKKRKKFKIKLTKTIIENIPVASINVGGKLLIDSKNYLYLSVGEGEFSENAQEDNNLQGKILRYDLEGKIPVDNPIPGSPIWSKGLRNVQGICESENQIYVSEHGTIGEDELNLLQKGGNYGWPHIAGKCPKDDAKCRDKKFLNPMEDWSPSIAPAGIAYYNHPMIPQWKNTVLMACLKTEELKVVRLNKAGTEKIGESNYFTKSLGRIRDIAISPKGRVYVCTSNKDIYSPNQSQADKIIAIQPGAGFIRPPNVVNREIKTLTLDSTVLEIKTIAENVAPWDFHWGTDNSLWFSQRDGTIKKINPKTGQIKVIHIIDNIYESIDNSGMHGFALDPDFPNNPYFYIHYCYTFDDSKIIRLTYDATAEKVVDSKILMDGLAAHKSHNGSRIVFGPDSKMYISMGDAYQKKLPQDLKSNNGKILRLNSDGSIPDDNPIPGSPVWSWGHRNPQGLVFGANGKLYSSEHGVVNDDELNLIRKGANYGWPLVQGDCDQRSEKRFCKKNKVADPLLSWTPTIGICGIDYYFQDAIPEWKNSILVTSLKAGAGEIGQRLFVVKLDEQGEKVISSTHYFDYTFGRLRDVLIHPDGDRIYLCTSNDEPNGNGKEVLKSFDDRIIELSVKLNNE